MKLNSKYRKYSFILLNLGFRLPALMFLKRLFYIDHYYFLTANLNKLNKNVRLRSDIRLEKSTEYDWEFILDNLKTFELIDRKHLIARYLFYINGFYECYMGKDNHGNIVSIQWIIRPKDNELIKRYMNKLLPLLNSNEVIVENIYIFPEKRGLGIFQTVNHSLLNIAKEEGFKICTACIRKDNITSINEFMKMGFKIKKMTRSYNFLGRSWRKI